MASSSSANIHNIADDFYFSALHDQAEIFPISDEKYAEQLQLQEALVSSISQTNASSSSSPDDAPSSLQKDAPSSSQKDAPLSSQAEIFPISDEKYAEQLQLEEALVSSITNASSSSSQKDEPSSSQKDAPSSLQNDVPSSLQNDGPSSSQEDASSSSSSQKDESSLTPATSSPPNTLKRKEPMETSEDSEEAQLPESFCGICMDTKPQSEMFSNAKVCGHLYCSDCIRTHVSVKIKENITEVTCPDPKCKGIIGPELCRSIVPKEVLERWEDALCESLILGSQKFYCPFKDCSAMLVDEGGEVVTSSECPNCNRLFCAQCKVAWHSGLNCSEFKNLGKDESSPEDIMLMELVKNKKWRRCPNCKYYVEKIYGCNNMSCRCGYRFCYGCGKKHAGNYACDAGNVAV